MAEVRGLPGRDGCGSMRETEEMSSPLRPPAAPAPRMMSEWRDAETNAAEWTRYLGFPDARVTAAGPDGGIDIRASGALGQVKHYAKGAIPAALLQQLYGAAAGHRAQLLFFTTAASFSMPAITYADRVGMALYRTQLDGMIIPIGMRAHELLAKAAAAHAPTPVPPAPPYPPRFPGPPPYLLPHTAPPGYQLPRPRSVAWWQRGLARFPAAGGSLNEAAESVERRVAHAQGYATAALAWLRRLHETAGKRLLIVGGAIIALAMFVGVGAHVVATGVDSEGEPYSRADRVGIAILDVIVWAVVCGLLVWFVRATRRAVRKMQEAHTARPTPDDGHPQA